MKKLSLVYPYYNSADLLKKQIELWNSFSPEVLDAVSIVIVDDCSKEEIGQFFKDVKFDVSLYRIDDDLVWNDGGASNLGVYVTRTKWLLRTDMDYIIPEETVKHILGRELNEKEFYIFGARYFHNKEKIVEHPSTILMTRDMFLNVGGYDEDFTGNHGHTDTSLRLRLNRVGKLVTLSNVWIEGILGGSTHELKREDDINYKMIVSKLNSGLVKPENMLRFAWHEVNLSKETV
jgi:GT2 family glycosyltransferase